MKNKIIKYIWSWIIAISVIIGTIFGFHGNQQFGSVNAHDGIIPDASMTLGATNPDIDQSNISQNICNHSWSTSTIRPAVSYTNKLKIAQIKSYGYSDTIPSDYEEDHLISLELGGNPSDPKNLWPESYKTTPNAKNKDAVENYLHKQVCNGSMTLVEAQTAIRTDWMQVYKQITSSLGSASGDQQALDTDDQ